jgi:hypothetical protein
MMSVDERVFLDEINIAAAAHVKAGRGWTCKEKQLQRSAREGKRAVRCCALPVRFRWASAKLPVNFDVST